MALDRFHPLVSRWFEERYGEPTPPQRAAWPHIKDGRHVLVAAPTGSGKTLSAFLSAIDDLVRRGLEEGLPDELAVLYVSPLKALSSDIQKNLEAPLAGISGAVAQAGLGQVEIRTAVRTGDTAAKDRAAVLKRPPHIFVTTPESLFILLTTERGRKMLSTVRTVIVDEIHALVRDKRGAHLALSLERLDALAGRKVQRIGLSATQKPIEDVARFLVGAQHAGASSDGVGLAVIDEGHRRTIDLALELPRSPLEAVMPLEVWDETYDRLAALVEEHTTTLIFTNTRRQAERVARFLSERLGQDAVTSHHGSLAREQRLTAEQRLKNGELRALVATASLELGIDVGDVDLVCQLGSPRSIATFLQRVGRSGHFVGGTPKGRLFPLSRDDLVECVSLLDAARRGELDRVIIPRAPLDILAQQIVAAVAAEDWGEDALFVSFTRAAPYRDLTRGDFDAVVKMLAEGFVTSRGRRGAQIHYDGVGRVLRARRGARLVAVTNGGAIPDNFDYEVVLEPTETRIGTVNEDFAIESSAGDIFQLGNTSYEILRVEAGKLRVADARGQPPTIPFWIAEAPSRTDELSLAVSRLRELFASDASADAAIAMLRDELGLDDEVVRQLSDYLVATRRVLTVMPTQSCLVAERFFDEAGGMHVVLHAPFGSRLTRALGLALRKRFCRSFNVELQAAATEDALVLSLGPMHSFPLETIFRFLHSNTARDVLVQALLDAPLFKARWRWNSTRALAVMRFRGGKKVPPRFQRMDADDLLALCFPDQVACLENIAGDREIPDHPLVRQTIDDSLNEAMDVDALLALLRRIESGDAVCIARDLTEPSPLAQEILTARPYAFLDDAPLEERRTQAVMMRRFVDPQSASDLGALDPAAIEQVVGEARPDPRDADELHDALMIHGGLPEADLAGNEPLFEALAAAMRAARLVTPEGSVILPAERSHEWRALHPGVRLEPEVTRPLRAGESGELPSREEALRELARGRLEMSGPATAHELARALLVSPHDAEAALAALEAEGFVLRGRYRPEATEEFCERRLLARIHRLTLGRLRREVEPVSSATFMRFLFRFHGAARGHRREGVEGLNAVIAQLSGFEAAASSWEDDILPLRVERYEPGWLDTLCLSGRVMWMRRSGKSTAAKRSGPVRTTPLAMMPRADLPIWLAARDDEPPAALTANAEELLSALRTRGASFFDELAKTAGLLRAQAEEALGELIARGLVTADSFSAMRTLLTPTEKRKRMRQYRHDLGLAGAGRFSLVTCSDEPASVEDIAEALLRRWGVVFRRLLERETGLPPWRELVRVYHRMEARGEIRGGRFVSGFSGEQFALPDAVTALRALRKESPSGALVSISGADPLNLLGIVVGTERLPATASARALFRDGVPVALLEGSRPRILEVPEGTSAWELERALLRQSNVVETTRDAAWVS
jgi:ATP-dependent helicase Lhr and Lhr-like helicase